ncbi:hypothetical protein LINPERHAP1_LOCUS12330 [Linum perenne]
MHLITFSFDLSGPSTKDLQSPLEVEDIPSDSTVLQLKLIISEMAAINSTRLSIYYSGQLLEDHRTVGHYISSEDEDETTCVSARVVVEPEHQKVSVMVIPSSSEDGAAGPTIVRVRRDSSVRELKDKICRKMGVYDVVMTCNGLKVDGDCFAICEFNIGEGSEVYVQQTLNVSPR